MALKLGNGNINKAYLGNTEIKKSYLGNTLIFDNAGFESEYQAVLDKATLEGFSLPSANVQTAQNELVKTLKSNGAFVNMQSIGVFSGSNSDFARIDWKNPNNVYSSFNTPSYDITNGFGFNGVNQYLSTNLYQPSSDYANQQYVATGGRTSSGFLQGASNQGIWGTYPRSSIRQPGYSANTEYSAQTNIANGETMQTFKEYTIIRDNSPKTQMYRDGIQIGGGNNTENNDLQGNAMFIGAYNNAGTGNPVYGLGGVQHFYTTNGANIVNELKTAFNTYYASI
jgi:hypothetical protein